jgi:linearmycin/streptolysin S transport system ATP-binding protein
MLSGRPDIIALVQEALPLQVRDVAKSFGGQRALNGVTLEVRRGEILGLLGPNGAGKTTLVRAVAGRAVPDAGELTVFGLAPADFEARSLRGWVPQEIALYPMLTPRENLWTFGRYQGLSGQPLERAVGESLDWIGLSDRAHERTDHLSGGMRRRLNIAAGTVHGPRLLLLDEPTVGVDPQSRERIYGMIEELKSKGVSLLYTTHYMEEAERLCDTIAIIDGGRIIAEGTKDGLVRSTIGTSQVVTVDADRPIANGLRSALEKLGATVEGSKVQLSASDPPRQIREILEIFHREKSGVRDLTLRPTTLEQVFLRLTGRELRE